MDTSKQYIEMCDCEEVQRQYNNKFGVSFFQRGESAFHDIYWENGRRNKDDIWLPRQDQIQEMMGFESLYFLLNNFIYYRRHREWWSNGHDDRGFYVDSMEQLWLAFYMYEEHEKIWNKQQWIKIKK